MSLISILIKTWIYQIILHLFVIKSRVILPYAVVSRIYKMQRDSPFNEQRKSHLIVLDFVVGLADSILGRISYEKEDGCLSEILKRIPEVLTS